jgi:DNA polymerase-1
LTDHSGKVLWDSLRSGTGLLRSQVRVDAICQDACPGGDYRLLDVLTKAAWEIDAVRRIAMIKPKLIVALGDWPLDLLTGQKSSDKWHMSLLPAMRQDFPKVLSLLHPERVFREYSSTFYYKLAAGRIAKESQYPEIRRKDRSAIIRPSALDSLAYMQSVQDAEYLSVDIETSQGQITCVGLAADPLLGISIPALPQHYQSETEWYEVWMGLHRLLKGPSKKVFQNGIFDMSYFSKYGLPIANFYHDTMLAQKVLYPEFPVGLDNIARIFTEEPFWKDDAKDRIGALGTDRLYQYNVKDAVVTLEAMFAQRADLEKRGLSAFFYDYVMKLASGPAPEMSWRGLPLDVVERERLRKETQARLDVLAAQLNQKSEELLKRPLNARSPTQVKIFLAALGYKRLPFVDGKETSNKGALMKLRLKNPKCPSLNALIEVSELQKEISSYLGFEYDPDDRVRYTLNLAGTETLRGTCYKDPWDRGLNAQTIPGGLKSMFKAPEGRVLIEVDLRQADARVVAWDSADPVLVDFYKSGQDIHRYVASQPELFNCDVSKVTKEQRQLGKKVGHAANYGVGPATLADSCLKEMNLVISQNKAAQMLQGYYRTFPGIVRWQGRIRDEVSQTRALTSPTGWKRYFYGRFDQNLLKEAYAWRPQHVVAYTINQLVLWLYGTYDLLIQTHDSLLIEVDEAEQGKALERICDQASWNPTYRMNGGELRIPIEIKVGRVWSEAKEVFSG